MDELRFRAAGLAGGLFLRALFATTRVEWEGTAPTDALRARGESPVFVCWHGQLLPLLYPHRGRGIVVLVSEHDDGEYITRVLERYGFATARGSSTRGGTRGLKALIRAAKEGRELAITPDGPRGPRHAFKPGALLAAQLTGHPLVPVGAGASRAWRLGSWDRFQVPKPGARIAIVYGRPRTVPRDADAAARDVMAGELAAEMDALTERAERRAGAA